MTEYRQCGYVKDNDEPCKLPASRDDGRCHHHTEIKAQRANGGRPTKLAARKDDILVGARQGMTIEGCARLAGVHKSTLYDWLEKYGDFSDEFMRARAQGELKHLQSVNDRGSQFLLERSFNYTKTEKREISGEGGAAIVINTVADDSDDD